MVKIQKLAVDVNFLKSMYQIDPVMLDEMALPSLFHNNPLVRWITSTRLKKALSFIELNNETTLLDFGCGPGVLLFQLPENLGDYYGVDIELWPAMKMVEHYKRKDIHLIEADRWSEVIPDGFLEYIVATEVLEHIEDVEAILTTFSRKLKTGGKLIVSIPTENRLYKLGRKIAGFSGHYHQEELVDLDNIYKQEEFNLEKKLSLPAPGIFCLYNFYVFSRTSRAD